MQRSRTVRRPRQSIPDSLSGRVPPGQIVTPRWPVLHQGEVPEFDPKTWDFRVFGLVESPRAWTWDAFRELPMATVAGDLHCVTRWSTFDHAWTGVRPIVLHELAGVSPHARFALLHGEAGYTANVPTDLLLGVDVILALLHDGEPLTADHGAPVRAILPALYAWKSVKWLRGIEFLEDDAPGFWEGYGYSNSADVWRAERFES